MFRKVFIILLFLLGLQSFCVADAVNVRLNRTSVPLNESFSIIFSTSENMTEQPDFTPLNTDFEILSNAQSYNTSIINGHVNQERSWTIVLMPKREGHLTLPAIQFGQHRSQSETIEVTSSASSTNDQSEPIYLETGVLPRNEAYEQTQLIYTVRLYRSVNIAQATLSEIKVSDPDAIIEKLGNDNEYEHMHADGRRYVVLERKYAIFPQKSGELVFSPIVFEGQVITGGNSFFNVQTQFKRVISDEEKVTVKPIPPPFQKHNWLAANDVAIVGEWSTDPGKLTVGEPITWTLTLTANGAMGSQLPDVSLQIPTDLRQYPDKPQVSNQLQTNGFVGVKQAKVVLIPSKAGQLTIPAISLKWWDLKEDQVREAKLPETVIQVQEGAATMNTPAVLQAALSPTVDDHKPVIQTRSLPSWVWFLVASNGVLMCILAFVLYRYFKPNTTKNTKHQFKQVCLNGDAKQAEAYLLAWAGNIYPQEKPFNLVKMKRYVPAPFQQALNELYEALYGKKNEWNGESLWKAFKAYKPPIATQTEKANNKILRDLYPHSE